MRPPPHKITGAHSGLQAARSELFLGFYDSVAGLVWLLYQDMQQDGPVGLATGIGKGVGGLVLKPISSMICVGAYSSKALQVELRKAFPRYTKDRALDKTCQGELRRKRHSGLHEQVKDRCS